MGRVQSLPKKDSLCLDYGFPGGSDSKASACMAGDLGSIPGSGRCPGEGNGNPLQYSCLENPMDGGVWWVTVHGAAKSRTRLSDFTFFLSFRLWETSQTSEEPIIYCVEFETRKDKNVKLNPQS